MNLPKNTQERWLKQLKSSESTEQLTALAKIGRSFFRLHEVAGRRDEWGPIRTDGDTKLELSNSLKKSLIDKLSSHDPDVRGASALALANWDDTEVIKSISALLEDPQPDVRLSAIQAMERMKSPEFLDHLFETAENDCEELVQAHAISTIGKIISKENEEANDTSGAVYTSGPVSAHEDLERLTHIKNGDTSSYITFLADQTIEHLTS